jgi:hypothetical protein
VGNPAQEPFLAEAAGLHLLGDEQVRLDLPKAAWPNKLAERLRIRGLQALQQGAQRDGE